MRGVREPGGVRETRRSAVVPGRRTVVAVWAVTLAASALAAVSADGRRAVTVSVTTTTALIDQDRVNRAVQTLTGHALCDDDA